MHSLVRSIGINFDLQETRVISDKFIKQNYKFWLKLVYENSRPIFSIFTEIEFNFCWIRAVIICNFPLEIAKEDLDIFGGEMTQHDDVHLVFF